MSAAASDRTLFVGARIPVEIRKTTRLIEKLDKPTFRKLVQLALLELQGRAEDDSLVHGLATPTLSEETLAVVLTGITTILRCAIRQPRTSLKQDTFKEDLKELKFPPEFVVDLATIVYGQSREALEQSIHDYKPRHPTVDGLKWRTDVTISTSSLSRALKPTITLQLHLSDKSIKTVELSTDKFHELRYNVAYMLKEMEAVESKSILKIQD
ncbi:HCaRG domain-containing protein [Capsaspora owczarzaki ATCC 30864]|uniref:COMM domain-containing protein 5 n=1 Tax=Capsaspora owczarzaki (strain ATCC 30864) TaxID=595528 RepID=A0A0D2U383_CAPO3|nr:HCaRG domain-containing protein [Capsaspora owczarzaki ATCC 30864]KJE89616.1 HCaRG domain-containing protein [Capsaspora owczarzaki ATCC 30864]|eukprot:XP_004365922.1 HCaRG domain-containing protein [Capsaspora owczarzaki ATCC 30864]